MKYFLLKVHYAPHMVGIIGVYDNQVAAEADCQMLEKERPSLSSYHTVADEEAFKRLIEGTKKIYALTQTAYRASSAEVGEINKKYNMKDLKKDLKKMFTDNFDVKLTKEELKSVLEENFDLTGIVLYKDTRKIHSVAYDGQGFESKKTNMINYDYAGDTVEEYLGVNRVVLATICRAINDEDGKEMNSEYPEDLKMDLETEGYVLTLTTQDADGTEETVKYLLPTCSVESIKIID